MEKQKAKDNNEKTRKDFLGKVSPQEIPENKVTLEGIFTKQRHTLYILCIMAIMMLMVIMFSLPDGTTIPPTVADLEDMGWAESEWDCIRWKEATMLPITEFFNGTAENVTLEQKVLVCIEQMATRLKENEEPCYFRIIGNKWNQPICLSEMDIEYLKSKGLIMGMDRKAYPINQ